jgi:hypothetical protein
VRERKESEKEMLLMISLSRSLLSPSLSSLSLPSSPSFVFLQTLSFFLLLFFLILREG